ncbi:hypothetical protein [Methylobacterium flocculans]|uniref:hypothetical protein n=1 Tax=Methylobacterium flocculans TaxID=2984843 RepID=UPI0021F2EEE0|nr:hypothetical protein [Methylobacterium sp. FF17]
MCAPFRNTDPTLTADDLASQVHVVNVAAHRLLGAVVKLAFEDATSKDFDNLNGARAIETMRATLEGSFTDLRSMFSEALGTPGAIDGSTASLVVALRARLEENEIAAGCRPRDPLATAMRRVDEAERGLILAAHGAGVKIPTPDSFQSGFHSPMAG